MTGERETLELLTPEEAARLLKVEPRTLAQWRTAEARRQPLPFVRVGGLVRYRIFDVTRFIEDHLQAA